MKLKNLAVGSALMVVASVIALASLKANFAGEWNMDKSKSEGLPPEMAQTMTVVQDGDKVSIETTVINGDQKQSIKDNYLLDGSAQDFAPQANTPEGVITGKGKRNAKWNDDGKGFVVSDEAKFESPEGEVIVTTVRKWALADDGKTLLIEINSKTPNGERITKRTFNRK